MGAPCALEGSERWEAVLVRQLAAPPRTTQGCRLPLDLLYPSAFSQPEPLTSVPIIPSARTAGPTGGAGYGLPRPSHELHEKWLPRDMLTV